MTDRAKIQRLLNDVFGVLSLVGVILGLFVFFLFSDAQGRSALSVLNLVCILWLVVMDFGFFMYVTNALRKYSKVLPSLLATQVVAIVYNAIVIVAVGISILLARVTDGDYFKAFLAVQLITLFLFVVAEALVYFTMRVGANVAESEDRLVASIDDIKTQVEMTFVKINNLPAEMDDVKKAYRTFGEKVKYISANASRAALDVEQEIREKFETFKDQLDTLNEETRQDALGTLTQLHELAQMRDQVKN